MSKTLKQKKKQWKKKTRVVERCCEEDEIFMGLRFAAVPERAANKDKEMTICTSCPRARLTGNGN